MKYQSQAGRTFPGSLRRGALALACAGALLLTGCQSPAPTPAVQGGVSAQGGAGGPQVPVRVYNDMVQYYDGSRWQDAGTVDQLCAADPYVRAQQTRQALEEELLAGQEEELAAQWEAAAPEQKGLVLTSKEDEPDGEQAGEEDEPQEQDGEEGAQGAEKPGGGQEEADPSPTPSLTPTPGPTPTPGTTLTPTPTPTPRPTQTPTPTSAFTMPPEGGE